MSQLLMEEPRTTPRPITQSDAPDESRGVGSRWLPPLVLFAVIAGAAVIYAYFWQHSRDLWWWMGHDRHTHYMFGLNLAMDVRTGDIVRMFHDVDRMRVWGLLHPVLVGLIQMVAGPDHRLAVLPSLAGWVMAVWFAFLIPRRLLNQGGDAAGVLAAFLVAVSPAHRAYATDVMYESLGAGLSLASIYLYCVALQDQTRRAAIMLGLTLTALFLHKYNYWLLVAFGIMAGEFLRQPRAWLQYGLSLCQRDRLPAWALAELKQPLNYITLALAGAALFVVATGGGTITVGSLSMSFQEPHNLVHVAYIAFFIRLVLWWRKTGRAWSLQLPMTLREVLLWHGGAMAVYFLLPKRLSYFLWYLSPYQTDQKRDSVPFMHGLPHYLRALQDDYLPLSWGLYLFVGMLILGLFAWRKLKPGAAAAFCFLLIAIYLTCQHPMLKYRFMHTWIAMGWVLGATGLVFAATRLASALGNRAALGTAWIASIVVIALHLPVFMEPGRAQEGGLKAELPCLLRIPDTYLPALADAKNPTIVSNVSARFLWTWTFIERHHHQNMMAEIKNFKTFADDPEPAKRWLQTTRSDALLMIDIAPGSTFDWKTDEYVDLTAFRQALANQTAWTQAEHWEMPEGVTITLWKKTSSFSARRAASATASDFRKW